MPTPTEMLQTALSHEKKTEQEIRALQADKTALKATNAQLTLDSVLSASALSAAQAAKVSSDAAAAKAAADLAVCTAASAQAAGNLAAANATITTLNNTVLQLQAELANAPSAGTGEIPQALIDEILAQSKLNDDLNPDVGGTGGTGGSGGSGGTTGDAAILAELTDNTAAGIDKRLGATAAVMNPTFSPADIWERPQVPIAQGMGTYMAKFSQGLGVQTTERFDYGSTEFNGLYNPDIELVVTAPAGKTTDDPNSTVNAGTGVYRLRTEEHAGGVVSEFPAVMWNNTNGVFPDRDSISHVLYNMHAKLGRPIAAARAKINRYDVGFVLYDESRGGRGFWGAVGTQTAYPSWAGTDLPDGKIPLSIALSSMNEFLFVGVHDRATGKGQIGVYWMWSGNDLLTKQNQGFPFDFPVAHPGLINSGMIAGTKLFGFFDVPVKYPTNIDAVCSPPTNSDRIQGFDGNASYLNIWDLSTEANRTAFREQNDSWVPTWMKVTVSDRYSNKVVTVDFTALSLGVRDQYFGSQAKYDQTAYQNPGSAYGAYTLTDPMVFPWGIEAKPEWAPNVTAVIDVQEPKYMIMSEHGDASIACACADGTVKFFKFDGTPNGSVHVGDNPVHMSHDKYRGMRQGGPVVTCRGSRSVVILDTWGPTATVLTTIQDQGMLDPVSASVGDTHGVQMRYIQVSDRNGRKLINYRNSPLKLATQGGAVYGMGPDGNATIERGGSFPIPGLPFGGTDSNVN